MCACGCVCVYVPHMWKNLLSFSEIESYFVQTNANNPDYLRKDAVTDKSDFIQCGNCFAVHMVIARVNGWVGGSGAEGCVWRCVCVCVFWESEKKVPCSRALHSPSSAPSHQCPHHPPLSSHVGCRLLGSPPPLPARVARGGGGSFYLFFSGWGWRAFWVISVLLRRGGRRAPGTVGRSIGGVGTRLAGYSRGGGEGSRRWMASTANRLHEQHDISWNESTHTHTQIHTTGAQAYTHKPQHLSPSYFQDFSTGACPPQNCRSKAFSSAVCGRGWRQVWHQGLFTLPITFTAASSRPVSRLSSPLSSGSSQTKRR